MHDRDSPSDGVHAADAPAEPDKAAYTVPQVARALELSERQVWAMVKSGEIRSYKAGWARRVPADEIPAYIARQLAA